MRRIAALAEAHYVTVAPHNPMGPLATAVNVHFAAAQPNFRILEYRLPEGPGYAFGTGKGETAARPSPAGARYVKDPYLPKDGYLELRPDRAGWGVEMDTELLGTEDYVNWQRKVPVKPDGSTGLRLRRGKRLKGGAVARGMTQLQFARRRGRCTRSRDTGPLLQTRAPDLTLVARLPAGTSSQFPRLPPLLRRALLSGLAMQVQNVGPGLAGLRPDGGAAWRWGWSASPASCPRSAGAGHRRMWPTGSTAAHFSWSATPCLAAAGAALHRPDRRTRRSGRSMR